MGKLSGEFDRVSRCLAPVRELFDNLPAAEFGPLALRAVRQKMVDAKLCRRIINQRVCIVRRVFRWAVTEELIPPSTYQSLQALDGLRRGKTMATDHPPVKPADEAVVEKVLPHCRPVIAAMVQVLRYCGCRPCELCLMRPMDLNTSAVVWSYRPSTHKGTHRGKDRVIFIGPRAQAVLSPFIAQAALDGYVFSPIREREKHFASNRAARKTRVQPSQKCRAKKRPQRPPGERYSASAVAHAVAAACRRAGVPRFGVYRLRHSHATEVRKLFGLEAAQVALGHSAVDVTQIYAERDHAAAARVAEAIG